MSIQSIRVNGVTHKLDYNGLDNLPEIPDLTDLTARVDSLEVLLEEIQQQLSDLENNSGSGSSTTTGVTKYVSNEKLSLSGSNVHVTEEKLQANGSEFSVFGEKLSIT